jgi:hypothetical protein
MPHRLRNSSAICDMEVATDSSGSARESGRRIRVTPLNSPTPCEGRSPNSMADGEGSASLFGDVSSIQSARGSCGSLEADTFGPPGWNLSPVALFECNLRQDVATDRWAASTEIREASRARAPDSPARCEGRSPNSMADEEAQFAGQPFWGCGRYPKCQGILKIS